MFESYKWFRRKNRIGWGRWGVERAYIFKHGIRSGLIERMTFEQRREEASQWQSGERGPGLLTKGWAFGQVFASFIKKGKAQKKVPHPLCGQWSGRASPLVSWTSVAQPGRYPMVATACLACRIMPCPTPSKIFTSSAKILLVFQYH